jgi:long-chain acyl-CoA synthetase
LAQTLIELLIQNADRIPNRPALREKRYGVWTPTTWQRFAGEVEQFALGLKALGLEKKETVAIVGDNKPEWVTAEFGTIAAGGVITGMYADCLAEEVLYLISYSDARIVVLSDQEQVDKILKVWPKIAAMVKCVIVWDSRGMSHYYAEHPFLQRFEKVLERGAQEKKNQPDFLGRAASTISPQAPAMMLTTSGTTALPKLAILSHENFLYAGENYGKVVPMEAADELLSLAPLPWIREQLCSHRALADERRLLQFSRRTRDPAARSSGTPALLLRWDAGGLGEPGLGHSGGHGQCRPDKKKLLRMGRPHGPEKDRGGAGRGKGRAMV